MVMNVEEQSAGNIEMHMHFVLLAATSCILHDIARNLFGAY